MIISVMNCALMSKIIWKLIEKFIIFLYFGQILGQTAVWVGLFSGDVPCDFFAMLRTGKAYSVS